MIGYITIHRFSSKVRILLEYSGPDLLPGCLDEVGSQARIRVVYWCCLCHTRTQLHTALTLAVHVAQPAHPPTAAAGGSQGKGAGL